MISKIGKATQIDIVYDSYIENSIKDSERRRRSSDIEPVEYVNLSLDSPSPVEIDRFWASSKNKERLQILSRQFFTQKANEHDVAIILSGYITDTEGIQDCVKSTSDKITIQGQLTSMIEEADCRLIPHMIEAAKCGASRAVVFSNDTDVAIYCLTYVNRCRIYGCREIWNRFGTGERTRDIPIHLLAAKLGENLSSSIILKAHVVTGCDVTSKIDTKSSALKKNPERFLHDFGIGEPSDAAFGHAEQYLVNVLQENSQCKTFDELRYKMYRTQNKGLSELPPNSHSLHGHLLRSHHFINFCLSLEHNDVNMQSPLDFAWKLVHGMLVPHKYLRILPKKYINRCSCKKGCKKGCGCKPELCTEYCKCEDCNNK